jgi:hypothetical protein
MIEKPDNAWSTLIAAPGEVIRLLSGEPVLLIGMGASALLALVAIFGPDTATPVAGLIAAVVGFAVVARAVGLAVGARRQPDSPEGAHRPTGSSPGSSIDAERSKITHSSLKNSRIRSRRSRINDVHMD